MEIPQEKHIKKIELSKDINYLFCDNPKCNHEEPIKGSLTQDLVGIPCPKCGESLLTQQDYEDGLLLEQHLSKAIDTVNSMSKEEIQELTKHFNFPDNTDDETLFDVKLNIHNKTLNIQTNISKSE